MLVHLLAITGGTLHELLKNGVLKLSCQNGRRETKENGGCAEVMCQ